MSLNCGITANYSYTYKQTNNTLLNKFISHDVIKTKACMPAFDQDKSFSYFQAFDNNTLFNDIVDSLQFEFTTNSLVY